MSKSFYRGLSCGIACILFGDFTHNGHPFYATVMAVVVVAWVYFERQDQS